MSVCLCGSRHNWQAGRLGQSEQMSQLREILIARWLTKCIRASSLPRTPPEMQQASCRFLFRSILLVRAAIFGHDQNGGTEKCPRPVCPCAEAGDGCEEPTSQFHTCLEWNFLRRLEISSSVEVKFWAKATISGGVCLLADVLTLASAFFFDFPAVELGLLKLYN
jgi:hypothetical protein